jgi:RNA recognition motif-containing protein
VGNLDISITDKELTSYFNKSFPSVISSRIIRDSISGKSRGFGFVNLLNFKEYNNLLRYHKDSFYLKGKLLTVK